jgi:hypothetical protein
MPTGGEFDQAKVIKRKSDADDNPMGNKIPTQSLTLTNMTSNFLMDLLEHSLPTLLPRIYTLTWIMKEDHIPASRI